MWRSISKAAAAAVYFASANSTINEENDAVEDKFVRVVSAVASTLLADVLDMLTQQSVVAARNSCVNCYWGMPQNYKSYN